METFFLWVGVAILALMLPIMYRMVVGPTAIDRIVAVNVMGTKTAILLIIIGILFKRVEMFVDFALTYALLNFIASIAAARFLDRVNPTKEFSTMKTEDPPG